MRHIQFSFLVSCLLVAGAASGCQWDSSKYDKFVTNGAVERCTGYCAKAQELKSKEVCENAENRGTWHDEECSNNNISVEDCLNAEENSIIPGYCTMDEDVCPEGFWYTHTMHEIGFNRYIKRLGNDYICGKYNDIVIAENAESYKNSCTSSEISEFEETFEYDICLADHRCVGAKIAISKDTESELKTAMCSKCSTGQALCVKEKDQAKCVDLTSDDDNCGQCNHICESDKTCNNGKCEPKIISVCLNNTKRCICEKNEQTGAVTCKDSENLNDSLADNEFCLDASVDMTCGITKCEDYTGKAVCGNDLKCRNKKDEGTSTVDDYYCACPEGTIILDDKCANRNDPATCGIDDKKEFTKCAVDNDGNLKEGVACNGTACICASPYLNCNDLKDGSGCKNLLSDHDNCGACGNVCQSNTICKNGSCVCEEGLLLCNGTCIDPMTDSDYCGAAGTCSEEFNEEGDNSNFKGNKCSENNSSGCSEGTCGCTGNYITVNGKCINPINDENYCGATSDEELGQNCTLVPNSVQCKSKRCVCQNGLFEVYDDQGKLLKCVDVTSDIEYCGSGTKKGEYKNCLEMCDGSNESTCNRALTQENINLPWSCIKDEDDQASGNCEQRCPVNKLTCRSNDARLVCVDDTQVSYTDEANHICACIKCDDDDDPTNGCSEYSVGESLDHCTACNEPCEAHYNACNKNELGGQVSYTCGCKTGEQVITFDGASHCLNPEVAHLEQKESGNWDCSGLWVDKNGDGSDGCEFDASSNPENCGTELKNCYTEHVAKASCQNGVCAIDLCKVEENGTYENCNNSGVDGCEINLTADSNNCGSCAKQCNLSCDYDGCNNKCESGKCCIAGELNSKYNLQDFNCCSGTRKYRYNYHALFPACWSSSHYGCYKDNPNTKCWTLAE